MKLRITRPAITSTTRATATSATTSRLRKRAVCVPADDLPPSLSAALRSVPAVWSAGARPKSVAVPSAATREKRSMRPLTPTSSRRGTVRRTGGDQHAQTGPGEQKPDDRGEEREERAFR